LHTASLNHKLLPYGLATKHGRKLVGQAFLKVSGGKKHLPLVANRLQQLCLTLCI
jgi:hypothetical protein